MTHALAIVAYVLHVGAGMTALVSGFIALMAAKGGKLHRGAGTVFVGAMAIMAMFAAYLAVAVPGQLVNLFIAAFTLYLLLTAWMTVRRKPGSAGVFEKITLLVGLCLCAPFAILSFQLATGMTPLFASAVPFRGPIVIAIYSFTGCSRLARGAMPRLS